MNECKAPGRRLLSIRGKALSAELPVCCESRPLNLSTCAVQRGVRAHQLHAGAEGAVAVHRHRVLLLPGRRPRVRHVLFVVVMP